MVRLPRAWRAGTAIGQRVFSPRSRLRRAFLRRQMISAYAAATREDYESMLVRYAPEVEFHFAPEFEGLGLTGTGRGHDGMLALINAFAEAWEQVEFRPAFLLDAGDHAVALGKLRQIGASSGLEFETEFAQLVTMKRGAITREQDFLSWEQGLQAAGLDQRAIAI